MNDTESNSKGNCTEMDKISSDKEDLKNKLVELTKQLDEVERQKKSANKGFNDEIKDLKEEIKMTIKLMQQMEAGYGE